MKIYDYGTFFRIFLKSKAHFTKDLSTLKVVMAENKLARLYGTIVCNGIPIIGASVKKVQDKYYIKIHKESMSYIHEAVFEVAKEEIMRMVPGAIDHGDAIIGVL